MTEIRTRRQAWLQLLRLPNLATVPGDPLAGAVLAAAATGAPMPTLRQALAVAAAALCLYMAGLVLNDLHDLPDDRLRRPERPLPRGLISLSAAWCSFVLLALLGLGAAALAGSGALLAGLVLLALVCLYDLRAKASPRLACLVMGLCRGASVVLGAAALGRPDVAALPAAAWTLYIGTVTWLSRGEDEIQRPGLPILLLPVAMGVGWLSAWVLVWPCRGAGLVVSAGCAAVGLWTATRRSLALLRHDVPPATARAAVGGSIGLLLPWQAGLVVLGWTPAAALAAGALLLLWPVSRRLARRFSPS